MIQAVYKPPIWLLESRVSPLELTGRITKRPRVTQQIDQASAAVVGLTAPAGFGKSVVASEWATGSSSTNTAWISLGPDDTTETFLHYLWFAFRHGGLTSDPRDDQATELDTRSSSIFLQSVLGSIERSEGGWQLVLEDVHLLRDTPVIEVISALLRYRPKNLQVLLTSRTKAVIRSIQSAAPGGTFCLDADDVRFTVDEVVELLGPSATRGRCRQLLKMTDGRPLFIRLWAEEFLASGYLSQNLNSSVPEALLGYVETQILEKLREEHYEAIQKLAVLPRFDEGVARSYLSDVDSSHVIDELAKLELIVTRNKDEGLFLTVQPTVRACLLIDSTFEDNERSRRYRLKAAEVLLEHQKPVYAVRLAVESGDDDFLASVVERTEPLYIWMRSGVSKLRRIIAPIPDQVVASRNRIAYAKVVYLIKCGRLREAQSLFDSINAPNQSEQSEEQDNHLNEAMERSFCRLMLAVYLGTPMLLSDIEKFEQTSPRDFRLLPIFRALCSSLKSYVYQQRGLFADAKREAEKTIESAGKAESSYIAYFMYCDLGLISGLQGKVQEAQDTFDAGDNACLGAVRDDERLTAIRDAFKLELEHEVDPTSTSGNLRLRNLCRQLPHLEGWSDVFAAAFRTYAEKLLLEGNIPAAVATIDAGLTYAKEQCIDGLTNILEAQKALMFCLAGSLEEANEIVERLVDELEFEQFVGSRSWREVEAIVEACVVLDHLKGEGRYGRFAEAAADHFEKTGNVRSQSRLVALRHDDDEPSDQVTEGKSNGSCSVFARGEALRRQVDTAVRDRVRNLGVNEVASQPNSNADVVYFTEKEVAVLERLCNGMTDKQIAKELGISPHGVRYHLKRIYNLLNIHNRNEVRNRINELGLLNTGDLASGEH